MSHPTALPFILRRGQDVIAAGNITSTKETIHGLIAFDARNLTIQWRLARQTDHIGREIRTDQEFEAVREKRVPLSRVAGVAIRKRWWDLTRCPYLIVTANDLRAFEEITGVAGLCMTHPAQLVFRLRRGDLLAAQEFVAELSLTLAERLMPEEPADSISGESTESSVRLRSPVCPDESDPA